MRVEIVLIVGIISFCCWCAYVVLKMNSNVPPAPLSEATRESHPVQDHQVPFKMTYPQASQNRQAEANSPAVFFYGPNATQAHQIRQQYFQQQQQQQQQNQLKPPYSVQMNWPPGGGGQALNWAKRPPVNNWQARPIPGSIQGGYFVPAAPQATKQMTQTPLGEATRQQVELLEEPDEQAELEPTDKVDSEQEEIQNEHDEEPDSSIVDEGPSGDERPENRELEEMTGRRSFSEDQSDATERDRDGKLVVNRSRHLINGHPVKKGTRKAKSDSLAELDAVAEEIEENSNGGNDMAEHPTGQVADETQLRGIVRAPSRGVGVSAAPQTGANESSSLWHTDDSRSAEEVGENSSDPGPVGKGNQQHRLHESLKAEQWDDEANSSPVKTEQEPEAESSEGGQEEENSEGTEEDPSIEEIDFKDLDSLADSDKFPFMEGATNEDRKRKKRETTDSSARLDRQRSNNTRSFASPLIWPASDVSETNYSSVWPPVSASGLSVDANASRPPSKVELVEGQEDISVEFLANPDQTQGFLVEGNNGDDLYAPAAPSLVQTLQMPVEVPINGTPTIAYHSTPLMAPLNSSTNEFTAMSVSPLTSGSKHNKKKVMKKKKKVKKYKSEISDMKHKSAKAHSMKKKSKFKKGGAKKAKKNSSKSHKEFNASTKGKKGAKGGGQKGAKKGSLFYKDKGYKKRGFKKNYQKLESGDHKTYFDEFRDKENKKKWKNFKDKHHYSQGKRWNGKAKKKYNNFKLKQLKDKKSGVGTWKQSEKHKYKKHYNNKSHEISKKKRKKKKKKMKKEESSF